MNVSTLCYINEQTSYPEDYQTKFGYKVHERGSRFYLTFDAVLQSFGVKNRNQRKYRAENIMERIQNDPYVQSQLAQNSWMGEIDHPASEFVGQELTMNRLGNPSPSKSSHYIRTPRLNGNLLEAHIQTDSSNENGMNMAIKIVDGKIIPAFSARVFGELQNQNGDPYVHVRKLITYDWVLFPSHAEALAKINQPMTESIENIERHSGCKILSFKELANIVGNNSNDVEFLYESFGLTEADLIGVTDTGNSIVLNEKNNIYIQPITDAKLRHRSKQMVKDWLNQ